MPYGDGTGPTGNGTPGRGLGPCGRGVGGGGLFGRGGRGAGRGGQGGLFGGGLPSQDERAALEQRSSWLKSALDAVMRRLGALNQDPK
jgi:hypothetical protein